MINRKKFPALLLVVCLFSILFLSCSSATGGDDTPADTSPTGETEEPSDDNPTGETEEPSDDPTEETPDSIIDYAPADLYNKTIILYKPDGKVRQKMIDLKTNGTYFFDHGSFTTVKQNYTYSKKETNKAKFTYIDSCYYKFLDHMQGTKKIYKNSYLIYEGDFTLVFTDEKSGTYYGDYVSSKGTDELTTMKNFVTGTFSIYE